MCKSNLEEIALESISRLIYIAYSMKKSYCKLFHSGSSFIVSIIKNYTLLERRKLTSAAIFFPLSKLQQDFFPNANKSHVYKGRYFFPSAHKSQCDLCALGKNLAYSSLSGKEMAALVSFSSSNIFFGVILISCLRLNNFLKYSYIYTVVAFNLYERICFSSDVIIKLIQIYNARKPQTGNRPSASNGSDKCRFLAFGGYQVPQK